MSRLQKLATILHIVDDGSVETFVNNITVSDIEEPFENNGSSCCIDDDITNTTASKTKFEIHQSPHRNG